MPDGFHDAFAAAVAGEVSALAPWTDAPDAAARLSVYRNTIAKGCADALIAQFPTVERLVGEAWLGAAAVAFAREHPPVRASLLAYGADFPAWLERFPPAAEMPWLPGIAALDMLWTEAHLAVDAPPLAPAALQTLAADDYARVRLVLHPAARFVWFDAGVPGLWLAMQADTAPAELELDEAPQGLLLVRPRLDITPLILSPATHALLVACRAGASVAEAAEAALTAEPDAPLDRAFAELIEQGAFSALAALEIP